jgi:pyruvate,water dikinase
MSESTSDTRVLWFRDIGSDDVPLVGGKAASLGEMWQNLAGEGVRVPNGFAVTSEAHREFLESSVPEGAWTEVDTSPGLEGLRKEASREETLSEALRVVLQGASRADHLDMHERAALARDLVLATPVPDTIREAVAQGYRELCDEYGREVDTAVRSSATREDSTLASFAGQYESFLNVRGEEDVVDAWRRCAASAFTERAVSYQLKREMDPLEGSVAVVVMKMVRSDLATSGVMFTLDPESGNRNVIHITSSYGLGELVVQGMVSPDTFLVWKEGIRRGTRALVHQQMGAKDQKMVYATQGGTTTESVDVDAAMRRQWSLYREEVMELAEMAVRIEDHYGQPMDIEWAKDGHTGELFIVQARPETVHSNQEDEQVLETYRIEPEVRERLEEEGRLLLTGQSVGTRIGAGKVRVYEDYEEVLERKRQLRAMMKEGRDLDDIPPEEHVFDEGDVLVTELTTPDWEPLMKDASLVVTEKGGRTSHAAIVAREFGIPAIVGADGATDVLEPLMEVTGSCAEGDRGRVYEGIVPFEVDRTEMGDMEELETEIKVNVGFPDKALHDAMLPVDGVGLARLEFILTAEVGVHPLALRYHEHLQEWADGEPMAEELEPFRQNLEEAGRKEVEGILRAIERRTPGYADKRQFFVDQLQYGVALICAAFYPRPVLVRLSDLKSNEYRELLAGRLFEPVEQNPMIAWRGASRYGDEVFLPAFEMECDALRFVRQMIGLDNLQVMVPFCRTPEEGRHVRELLDRRGLGPEAGVPLYLMVELPSNVIEGDRFIDEMGLAGGSIGTNDLVQTVYAVSRDDMEGYERPVDARSPAVKEYLRQAIQTFRERGIEIGICGQAPSDHPEEVPRFLVECGISSISVTPDTVLPVRMAVAEAERETRRPVAAS